MFKLCWKEEKLGNFYVVELVEIGDFSELALNLAFFITSS